MPRRLILLSWMKEKEDDRGSCSPRPSHIRIECENHTALTWLRRRADRTAMPRLPDPSFQSIISTTREADGSERPESAALRQAAARGGRDALAVASAAGTARQRLLLPCRIQRAP